jgi:hypothetical protein
MPDLAFDPYALPTDAPPPEAPPEPEVQVAQAEPPPPPPPATGEIREKAMIPGLPDRTPTAPGAAQPPAATQAAPAAPAPAPGTPSYTDRPDEEDERDFINSRLAESQIFKGTLREHQAPYNQVTPPNVVDYRQLPQWQELQRMRQNPYGLQGKEAKAADAQIKAEENRLIAETKYKNDQATKAYAVKHRDDLSKIDAPRESMEQRQKTFEVVEGARSTREAELKTQLQSNDPADKNKADYALKVSPMGTMKPAEFSEATTQIGVYNGHLTPRQVIQYGTILGSPVNRNEKGELQPGANEINGKKAVGKAATAYTVVGRDSRGNILAQMPDKEVIRIPTKVFDQFAAAREKGYAEQKKWWAARKQAFENAAKDDWVTRQVKGVVDWGKRQ